MKWYEEICQERSRQYAESHEVYYSLPSTEAVAPFRIADNLYYVGDRMVCVHLIKTNEGLILIDAGFSCAKHLLLESIIRLGFDPADVRWIILTHAHHDHFGAANEFRNLYGTKVAISAVDAASMRERPTRAAKNPLLLPVIDRELQDGEIFSFGGCNIRCVLTPGHTLGVMSFFFQVTDNGKSYMAGLFGGAGHKQVMLPYLLYHGLPTDMPQRMIVSLEKVENETVEVHLGNHPANNHTLEKRDQQLREGGNPFIDSESWRTFIRETRAIVQEVIRENVELEQKM